MSELVEAKFFVFGRPFLLNAERESSRWRRVREVKFWREAAGWAAVEHDLPKFERVHVEAIPHVRDGYKQDVGACFPSVKAIIDGLVDVEVLSGDGPDVVKSLKFWPVVLKSERGDCMEIILREA